MMQTMMKQMTGGGAKKRKRMMRGMGNLPGGMGGLNLPGM